MDQAKNLVASVRQRLLNCARLAKDEPQLVLMRYGLERLMYRLSQSDHAGEFVVKGAMLFVVWTGEAYRATKDLDLLALNSASAERFREIFHELCHLAVVDDGLVFQPDTVRAAEIREGAVYQGVRVRLEARLGKARIPLQVDIGFGDAVTPKPGEAEFPSLLNFPAPRLAMYPKVTVVAEKFEAMVKLGVLNSRMKDFYDIWVLSGQFEFYGAELSAAIRATFRRRRTQLPAEAPFALSGGFSADAAKQTQWRAFVQRGRLRFQEPELDKVVDALRGFLMPAAVAAAGSQRWCAFWPKGGPWRPSNA